MRPGALDDLSETLARASAIAAGLGEVDEPLPVEQRPGFLVGDDPQPIIKRLATAERVTFVLGAGASTEAGLPSRLSPASRGSTPATPTRARTTPSSRS